MEVLKWRCRVCRISPSVIYVRVRTRVRVHEKPYRPYIPTFLVGGGNMTEEQGAG